MKEKNKRAIIIIGGIGILSVLLLLLRMPILYRVSPKKYFERCAKNTKKDLSEICDILSADLTAIDINASAESISLNGRERSELKGASLGLILKRDNVWNKTYGNAYVGVSFIKLKNAFGYVDYHDYHLKSDYGSIDKKGKVEELDTLSGVPLTALQCIYLILDNPEVKLTDRKNRIYETRIEGITYRVGIGKNHRVKHIECDYFTLDLSEGDNAFENVHLFMKEPEGSFEAEMSFGITLKDKKKKECELKDINIRVKNDELDFSAVLQGSMVKRDLKKIDVEDDF